MDKEINDELKFSIPKEDLVFLDNLFPESEKILCLPTLTKKEERQFLELIKGGDEEARKRFIEHNLKFVVYMTKKYGKGYSNFRDLFQEGVIGLMIALEKFDIKRTNSFASYAGWWIRLYIQRAIMNKSKLIRIPIYLEKELLNYNKNKELLGNESAYLTNDELAEMLELSVEKIKKYEQLNLEVLGIGAFIPDVYSQEIRTDEKEQIINDSNFDNPVLELILNSELKDKVELLLKNSSLTDRELIAISLYCGFNVEKPYTTENIAQLLKISRYEVSKLVKLAIRKLKMSPYILNLMEYADNPESVKKEFALRRGGK